MAVETEVVLRLAEHLATLLPWGEDCEVATQDGKGRCIEEATAVRWESGFVDMVCDHHADRAEGRGALIVRPKRHDGTERIS